MASMTIDRIQAWLDTSPYVRFLGLRCVEMDVKAGTLTIEMPMRAECERADSTGHFHGGPVASLIDTVGDFAIVMSTGAPVPTINFRVDYLRPSGGTHLLGKALVRRVGKTVGVVDVDVFDDQNRLTAVGRCCFGITAG